MTETPARTTGLRLTETQLHLSSRLADLARVFPWVEALAVEFALPEETVYAIHLCLEEALANIVRHGYRGEPGHPLSIEFRRAENGALQFVIEDEAPHFAPPDQDQPLPAAPPDAIGEIEPGGQGLRLMRRFAGSLRWEPLPHGNRLTIGFSGPAA